MNRWLLLLAILTAGIARDTLSQNPVNDEKLRDIIRRDGQVEVSIPFRDIKSADILTRNVSILSVENKVISISLSSLTVDWFISQKFDYTISPAGKTTGLVSAESMTEALNWNTYPTFTQYDSIMRSFSTLYPSLCRLDTIGKSVNGRLILVLKISDNVSVDEDEPEVFYTSTMHGDETGGYVMMLRLADYLLRNYNTSSRVKNMTDNLEIWINPLANPDGTYRTGNTMSSPVRYNANGVDLNRNFPDPLEPGIIQQKETSDMILFMRKHRFVISANFHAGKEVVNYPWDRYLFEYHADDTWFYSISRAYADTVHVYSGPSYMNFLDNGVTRGAVWYVVYGGRQDFVTSDLQGREVTIELDDLHVTPASQLSLLWQNNWRSMLGYLENALYGIHGIVLNSQTSAPVSAKVYITGHDTDSSHVYSDRLTGSFVRLLSPGSWNLTFSAKGYRDTTIYAISLFSGQKTDIIVNLEPKTSTTDTIPAAVFLYPVPAKNKLNAVLTERTSGQVNVRIFNQTGMLMSDYDTIVNAGVPLNININGLASGLYSFVFTNKVTRVSERARFMVIK
jgi:hypothetical protein